MQRHLKEKWVLESGIGDALFIREADAPMRAGTGIAAILGNRPTEERLAKGRLMAAAPDLLKQLDIACRKLQEIGLSCQIAEIPELVDIRAAIERAS